MVDYSLYENCKLCPRKCSVNRNSNSTGFCGQTSALRAARAALHFWEEPIVSGTSGSGTVFFSGCNLRCIFCQNYDIALGEVGKEISAERLSEIFLELESKGANNINLVTGAPFIPHIASAISSAKNSGLSIPVLYNSGGYEDEDSLKLLDGLIDIYMPDMKYFSNELSAKYSNAPDYFVVAKKAIGEMYRQVGAPILIKKGAEELMTRGVIVRHLLLPGQSLDSKKILRYLHETYGDSIYISIMNQYTPLKQVAGHPELDRKITSEEYEKIVNFAIKLGIDNAFIQEGDVATESFIPSFDYEGL